MSSFQNLGFSSCFDGGNGKLVTISDVGGLPIMRVNITNDPYTEVDGRAHKMWFHFKVSNLRGLQGKPLTVVLPNAGDCSYPGGWGGEALKGTPEGAAPYRACFSVDRQNWLRLNDTSYEGGELRMTLDAKAEPALEGADFVYLAYFAPYSQEQHMDLMATVVASSAKATVRTIGHTLDGADMELVTVRGSAKDEDAKKVWFIARQHPGESQASWWIDGFLRRLLDPSDPIANALLAKAVVHVVPMMNPDGARRGYLRTNAAGANLNREWQTPKLDYSPEVFHVLREMHEEGLDFCLDVHGDEALPYNFIAGGEGCPCWSDRLAALQKEWCDAYERTNPDFQQVEGYPVDKPNEANLAIGSNGMCQAFDALVMTMEMPFKDNANAPDMKVGWSADRCRRLGEAALDPTLAIVDKLR